MQSIHGLTENSRKRYILPFMLGRLSCLLGRLSCWEEFMKAALMLGHHKRGAWLSVISCRRMARMVGRLLLLLLPLLPLLQAKEQEHQVVLIDYSTHQAMSQVRNKDCFILHLLSCTWSQCLCCPATEAPGAAGTRSGINLHLRKECSGQ